MNAITGRVGPNQPNSEADVTCIQKLLNQHLAQLSPLLPLKEDGDFGAKTEAAINLFQSRVLGLSAPDGIVAPDSPTWQALAAAAPAPRRQLPANVVAFLSMALPAAQAVSKKWSVPVSVILGQSALESGWGQHVIQNAYFGIKGRSPSGGAATFATTEVINGKVIHIQDTFRAYTSYEDSADDYGRFLNENPRYRPAFAFSNDGIGFIQEVAKAGYATAPNYAQQVTAIITGFNLTQYDAT